MHTSRLLYAGTRHTPLSAGHEESAHSYGMPVPSAPGKSCTCHARCHRRHETSWSRRVRGARAATTTTAVAGRVPVVGRVPSGPLGGRTGTAGPADCDSTFASHILTQRATRATASQIAKCATTRATGAQTFAHALRAYHGTLAPRWDFHPPRPAPFQLPAVAPSRSARPRAPHPQPIRPGVVPSPAARRLIWPWARKVRIMGDTRSPPRLIIRRLGAIAGYC